MADLQFILRSVDFLSEPNQLSGWLESEGWSLRELPLGGTCEGYTDHHRPIVVTDTHLDPAARPVVLLHDAAHAVLHRDLNSGQYQQHREVCDTEAESTAYVLANLLDIHVEAFSISYVAGWCNADASVLTAGNLLRAVNRIAHGIGLDDDIQRIFNTGNRVVSSIIRLDIARIERCD